VVITYDQVKRTKTIAERQLDFEDAKLVFEATSFETEDSRKDYGEKRIICFGISEIAWLSLATPRVARIGMCSCMRKANDREQALITPLLGI